VLWLIVALVTWPLIALLVGMLLGRGIAAGNSNPPILSQSHWLLREIPHNVVAPPPAGAETTRI
jgi:hypothetical protein